MFIGCFENRTLIICESILIICSSILFSPYNRTITDTICKATQVPYDLALTATSAGFGNNIMILLSTFEIVLVVLFIEKLVPTCVEKLIVPN